VEIEHRRKRTLAAGNVHLTVQRLSVSLAQFDPLVELLNAGKIPNYEASIGKVFTEELRKRAAATGMEVLGLYSQLSLGEPHSPDLGKLQDFYLAMVSATIVGGSSEIQRNVIATRGLGLPRG